MTELETEIVNLYLTARTAITGLLDREHGIRDLSRYERMIWAADEFAKVSSHNMTHSQAYQFLSRSLESRPIAQEGATNG